MKLKWVAMIYTTRIIYNTSNVPQDKTHILICQNGYIYSSITQELAEYFNFSSCFNCWIYKTSDYLHGIRYSYYGFVGAINLPHELIPWNTYINHSHNGNCAFSYEIEKNTPWGKSKASIGNPITLNSEKNKIFLDFMGKLLF